MAHLGSFYGGGTLGAWYDPLVSAVSGGASSVGREVAAGAAPAMVTAIRQVLPDAQKALAAAMTTGFAQITRDSQAALIATGVLAGMFVVGSLTLMYAQYHRLTRCCPTGVRG